MTNRDRLATNNNDFTGTASRLRPDLRNTPVRRAGLSGRYGNVLSGMWMAYGYMAAAYIDGFHDRPIDLCPVFKTILYDSNQQGRTLPSTPYARGLPRYPADDRHNETFGECGKHLREAAVREESEVTLFNYDI